MWTHMRADTPRCLRCGASKDYVKNTKNEYHCSICGNKWKRRRQNE